MACFSDVASQWMSTTMTLRSASSFSSRSAQREGLSHGGMKTFPMSCSTPNCTQAAVARNSATPQPLLRVINRPHLADYSHFDLSRILQLRLDLARDVLRQPDGLLVADLLRVHDDAKLAPGLDGEALGDALHLIGDRLEA